MIVLVDAMQRRQRRENIMKRYEKLVEVDGKKIQVLFVEREKKGNTRVHVFVEEGTETVLDDLVKRRSRPVEQWRVLATRVMRELGFNPELAYVKLRWSQKAGCSCGCSPGFVMADHRIQHVPDAAEGFSWTGFDVMITPVSTKPAVVPDNILLSEN